MGRVPLSAGEYDLPGSNHQALDRPARTGYPDRRYGNDRQPGFRHYYRPFYGVAVPYSAGWIEPSYLGYDSGFYDDMSSAASQPPASNAAEQDELPMEQETAPPAPAFRSAYQRPEEPEAPLTQTQAAVTLVFKDGRPTEQIRNYMLTRKTLYVQDQRLREIPVDQLDLAATEKLNREAGVDFRLPGTSQ